MPGHQELHILLRCFSSAIQFCYREVVIVTVENRNLVGMRLNIFDIIC